MYVADDGDDDASREGIRRWMLAPSDREIVD